MLLGFASQCDPPHDPEDIRRVVHDLARRDAAKAMPVDVSNAPGHAAEATLLTAVEGTELDTHYGSIADRDFILQWKQYGSQRTDAPVVFHELVAITLVAMAINRNRYLDLEHKRIFPNVFGLGLASSGRRKSTPMNYEVEVAREVFPTLVLSSDYSPEALIADLAGRQYARGTMFVDEAARLFTTMRRTGYGEALKDLLSRLWDAPERESRKLRKETFALESVYLNACMTTTPSRFVETMTSDDIASGFLARFLIVMPRDRTIRNPRRRCATSYAREDDRRRKEAEDE